MWRRFTIGLRRRLADRLGVPRSELHDAVVPSFAKVAEIQRRGVVHFHALMRLDGPGGGHAALLLPVSAEEFGDAVTVAAYIAKYVTKAGEDYGIPRKQEVPPRLGR
ncbi:hypothetical protein CLV92_114104 [Kineococcus xinjiangensis]|uniref:Uncharacterized protein n=1 Tax=Kineococcus xinjiangensis TaxID=512762 RepID=A0A2S6IE85_9ACTN|nr:replication initiator [Kineococcus xinjiangensis]PPK92503.1 hypothetical protein CLV92_114104 [Kineococcus xinjiangensis]